MTVQLNIEEYLCVICREILTHPVTLPCLHTCCLYCLEKTLDSNRYQCFLCRKFIGSWFRNAKRRNELINHHLSEKISEHFPDLIQKKMNGETIDILPDIQPLKMSLPGEIKEEFELFIHKFQKETLAQQEKENKLSEEFIKQLQEEEDQLRSKQEEILKCDELIARELALKMDVELQNVKENEQIQLSSDEKLAKKLAFNENSVRKLNNISSKYENGNRFSRKLTFVKHYAPINSKIISPKTDRMKQNTSVRSKFGPMDRFLEFKTRK